MSELTSTIQNAYASLTGKERQLADIVLENPEQPAIFSASELARRAQVSNSTVTRLVKQLGFANYDHMRKLARREMGRGSPLSLFAAGVPEEGVAEADSIKRFADQETMLLRTTLSRLDAETLDEITTRLCEAGNLGFLGLRNSHFFAAYARWQFIQFREKTRQMPGAGETIAERIADLGPGDVVMIVAVRRLVGKLRRYVQAISKTGADVLLITDPTGHELGKYARWTIFCSVENEYIFDSYAGVLAVIRLLAYKAFLKSGRDGREYMLAIERQHDVLAEFD